MHPQSMPSSAIRACQEWMARHFTRDLRRERPGLTARTVFITGGVAATGGRIGGIRQPVIAKPFAFETLEETLVALMRGTSIATPVGWP